MRLLVLRFTKLGDVALLAPVLDALARDYSNLHVILVTRKEFEAFFHNIPGVEVIGVDLDREYRGLYGLYRLYRELLKLGPYTHGIDLQATFRSRFLKFFLGFSGIKFASIVKGQREKRLHTRPRNKILKPLPHVIERYMHVFERAGLHAKPAGSGPFINPDTQCRALAKEFRLRSNTENKRNTWIGIAPFAGTPQKTWPPVHTHELLSLIHRNMNATVFLFGGGEKEIRRLREMRAKFPNTVLVAGELPLEGEMALILKMDIMISMDAFNMHLAALLGKKVLSIWGATHYFSGFGPYGQPENTIIEVAPKDLSCRPCSITGDRACRRGDLACLNWITARQVYTKLQMELAEKESTEIYNMPHTD